MIAGCYTVGHDSIEEPHGSICVFPFRGLRRRLHNVTQVDDEFDIVLLDLLPNPQCLGDVRVGILL